MSGRITAAIAVLLAAIAEPAARPAPRMAQDRGALSLAELIERVDRATILENLTLRPVTCWDGEELREVMQYTNPWPYAYAESAPEPGTDWVSVQEYEPLHSIGTLHESYTYDPGARHTEQTLRRATTYRFAPLPSDLALGTDSRVDNWAFPESVEGHRLFGMAHDGDFDVGWNDAEMARALMPGPGVDPEIFRVCYQGRGAGRCFGTWGPRDGTYPLTGWMPDAGRRMNFLRLLYSAELSRRGPSSGRTFAGLGLEPHDTGPEPEHFLQPVFPDNERAFRIGDRAVADRGGPRHDRVGAILMGWFRRPAYDGAPCESVEFLEEGP